MLDLAIILLFAAVSVYLGFRFRQEASRGPEDYFLAGRSLKGWKAGISMAATQFSADTPLLVAGLVATAGIFSLWRLWVYALAFLLMGFLLAPGWRRSGVLTDAELTELRYSGKGAAVLRALKALYLGTFVNCAVLAMVLLAATRIAEPFLLWHEWLPGFLTNPLAESLQKIGFVFTTLPLENPQVWLYSANNFISILMIVFFTALYSMSGGLRAVVATDVLQFALAMAGTVCYAVILWYQAQTSGGWQESLSNLYGNVQAEKILSFGPIDWDSAAFVFIAVLSVQWFAQMNADGTGYLAQRSMACRSDRDAKIAAVTFTAAQILLRSLVWIPIALGLLILYPAEAAAPGGAAFETFRSVREGLFAQGIKDFLPPGIRGLMLTGMLAALASTVDTHLNWGASYWTHDLYKRFLMQKFCRREPSNKELVWIAKVSNLFLLALALLIMSRLSSIQTAWHLSLLFGSGLGVVLILRWIWHRINLWSEVAAIGVSFVFAPVLMISFPELSEGVRLLMMVFVSTLVVLTVTLLTPPESTETLVRFYRKVRPVGFWSSIALASGDSGLSPLREFKRGLGAMVTCALSVFFLLRGLGGFLTEASLSSMFLWGLIAAGLGLVPLWLHLGFSGTENAGVEIANRTPDRRRKNETF